MKKLDNKEWKIGEACSSEVLHDLKKNTKKIIFRENEIDERIGFGLKFLSIMEAVVATCFVKVLLDEIEVGGIFLWLVLNVFVIAFFYATQLVFGLIHFLIVVKIRKEIKRFQFRFLSDVTISYADIVHVEGNEITYIDHGIEQYYREHSMNESSGRGKQEGLCKERFIGRFMYDGKVKGRLLMLRGKDFKGRNVLYTVFEDEETQKKHYPDNYTRKERALFYPHPNVVLLHREKEKLDEQQKKVSEKRYQRKWIFTWTRRIGVGIAAFFGLFFFLLCMMLWDTGEISVMEYKRYTIQLLFGCLAVYMVLIIITCIYGRKAIIFTWRKQMLFAGWDMEDSNGAKIKVLKAYEYGNDKFLLHSFQTDSINHNFVYGELIYCYGGDGKRQMFWFMLH